MRVAPPLGVGTATRALRTYWWQLGTRTQWNPHPDLDIGVDVLWTQLHTAYKGSNVTLGAERRERDSVMFRIQRNFLP